MKFPKFHVNEYFNSAIEQEVYDDPHAYKHPELGYIEIMAQKGRAHAAKVQDSDTFDQFQHILDNVKILVDRLG